MTIQIFKGVQNQELVLKADYDKLAPECAALKAAINKLTNWERLEIYSSAWEFNNGDGFEAFELLEKIETPAADAARADLKAQGVEILTGNLQRLIDEGMFDAKEIGVIAGAIYEGAQIAAQLRSGKDGE